MPFGGVSSIHASMLCNHHPEDHMALTPGQLAAEGLGMNIKAWPRMSC